ncbi:MAG: DUF1800 domain-containing protein [Cyclobacteriaceae bacterium]
MKLTQVQIQHFYNRAGFGESLSKVKSSPKSAPKLVSNYFGRSNSYKELPIELDRITYNREATSEEKAMMRKMSRDQLLKINTAWMKAMVNDEGAMREKMAFFWHDHFACEPKLGIVALDYVEILRKHALGSFKDLLFAVSKSPSMIQYLNNRQNRKNAPNENFAREVMELFTLGIGNYTEKDIKESARSFTGWITNKEGEFIILKRAHDYGLKEFMGHSGHFGGEDILNMLLENKQTARYISSKVYKYFVNQNLDEEKGEYLADVFYDSGYEISSLLQAIYTSDWFFEKDNVGNKIKSPIELLVGYQRSFHLSFPESKQLIFLQKILGQTLLQPPNVAGWPGGRSWIDSSSLIFRLRLSDIIFYAAENDIGQKQSIDDNDALRAFRKLNKIVVKVDNEKLKEEFSDLSSSEVNDFLTYNLDQESSFETEDLIEKINYYTKIPEYQLC